MYIFQKMNFYEIETSILRIFPNINLHEVVKIENEEVGQILMKYGAKGTDLKDFEWTKFFRCLVHKLYSRWLFEAES